MSITKLLCCAGGLLLLLASNAAQAQPTPADTARNSARTVLLSIPRGSPIRVLTVGQSTIEGRLSALSDTGIVVRRGDDSSHASIARIAEIYRPAPSYRRGAIVGGIIGGVLGGLSLGILATGLCETNCGGAFGYGAPIGAALGGAIGAVTGLIVGSVVHHWERVWPIEEWGQKAESH